MFMLEHMYYLLLWIWNTTVVLWCIFLQWVSVQHQHWPTQPHVIQHHTSDTHPTHGRSHARGQDTAITIALWMFIASCLLFMRLFKGRALILWSWQSCRDWDPPCGGQLRSLCPYCWRFQWQGYQVGWIWYCLNQEVWCSERWSEWYSCGE